MCFAVSGESALEKIIDQIYSICSYLKNDQKPLQFGSKLMLRKFRGKFYNIKYNKNELSSMTS